MQCFQLVLGKKRLGNIVAGFGFAGKFMIGTRNYAEQG
jgi:hypothetical protein